jgi:MoaA/NifB/PqqE/SkfB family radical SAM enzyme
MKILHIEPSSRCTLACPQCPRTEYIDRIVPEDCDIDVIARACRDFDAVIMCGNHGDPIYHHDFHGLLKAIKLSNPKIGIRIVTNGAFRSAAWWQTTVALLDASKDSVTFSIDGIPSNNHLYRVNSKWPSIETAIRTISSLNPQLTLIWKWILFKYNEDDISAGIELADELGIKKFIMVSSVRYEPDHWLTPSRSYDEITQETLKWYQSLRAVNKAQ